VEIFRDRTYGWQLDIADKCINGDLLRQPMEHSGFATLLIVLSYFEMIAKHQTGYLGRESKKYFKKGVFSVYPNLLNEPQDIIDDLLDTLYYGARCGLYHNAITNSKIGLTGNTPVSLSFDPTNSRLIINPHRLVPTLKGHLNNFIAQLRDPNNIQLRQKFERRFDTEP
jgi:hypothetical protein